jgi:hypothetical protein
MAYIIIRRRLLIRTLKFQLDYLEEVKEGGRVAASKALLASSAMVQPSQQCRIAALHVAGLENWV